jgi:transcriptional regulator with XRE-family HTH domain
MEFSQSKLKEIRLKMGWSQSDMARRLNTNVHMISGIEEGILEIPNHFQTHLVFLMNQLEILTEEIHLQPQAESLLENEGLFQVYYSDLRDKILK